MKLKGTPHDKLREAKFFLERLEHSDNDDDLEALDFDHYLSAFLSAGESVIEVLRKTHNPWVRSVAYRVDRAA